MANYNSNYTGAQIDEAVRRALNPDAAPTENSTELVESGGVYSAIAAALAAAQSAAQAAADAAYPHDSIENQAVASFPDGADDIPVKSLTVNIDPVQAAGTPTPQAPLPISGWTGANVHNTRYGIFPIEIEKVVAGYYVLSIQNKQIRKTYTGATANNFLITGAQVSEVFNGYQNIPAGRYSFKGALSSSKASVTVTALFATPVGTDPKSVVLNGSTVDIPVGHALQNITMSVDSWAAGDWVQLDDFVLAIEPENYPVAFPTPPGTVYGGTLTDNGDGTWTLTVTHRAVELSTLEWDYNEENHVHLSGSLRNKGDISIWAIGNAVSASTIAAAEEYVGVTNTSFNADHSPGTFAVTAGQFIKFMNAVGSESDTPSGLLVYKRVTPASYTLSAATVKTLLGNNNIFADTGDVAALTYRADTTLYIEKKVSP